MKNALNLILTGIFFSSILITIHAQTVTVGSGVNIPEINSSNIEIYFDLVSGTVIQDIIIDGDLEMYDLENITFYGISITGGNLTLNTATSHIPPRFRGCQIQDGGNFKMIDGAVAIFIGTIMENWDLVEIKGGSVLTFLSFSGFEDIDNFEISQNGVLYAEDGSFVNAPLVTTGPFKIIMKGCTLENNIPAAITLQYKGSYEGIGNTFNNNEVAIDAYNGMGFIYMSEHNSTFFDNSDHSIRLRDVYDIKIINNQFLEEVLNGNIIGISGGFGTAIIEDNIISGNNVASRGISILHRGDTKVVDNTIEGISGGAAYFAFVNGLTVEDNEVLNNPGADGIIINGCSNATLYSNNVSEHSKNVDIFFSDFGMIMSNICSEATDANIYVTNSQSYVLCDNLCYQGKDGIVIAGTDMKLELNDNGMSHCDRGLVYKQDVLTNAQIERGNYFTLNTLGAEFEEATDPDFIDAMRYVVRNYQSEYPSHIPSAWFQPTGTTALVCDSVDSSDPPIIAEPDVNNLFLCAGSVTPDGMCTNNMMIALQMIETQPSYLSNVDIEDFYDTHYQTTLDFLPTMQNINSMVMNGSSLAYPVLEIDTIGNLLYLEELDEYLIKMDEEYEEIMAYQTSVLDSVILDLIALIPANDFEEKYQFIALEVLELFSGNLPSLDSIDKIVNLAEGCIAEDGPSVYLAQVIANALEINYIKSDSCASISLRSDIRNSNSSTAEINYAYPNPASNTINLPNNHTGQSFTIRDIFGNVSIQRSFGIHGSIDINILSPGIYLIKENNSTEWIKFVKI